jgi:flagellar protein FlgJ
VAPGAGAQRQSLPAPGERLPIDSAQAAGLPGTRAAAAPDSSPAPSGSSAAPPHARDFVARIWPHALEASRATGIPAHFLVAHAALETGWGRSELRTADGKPTYNLFNIKAGRSFPGDTAEAMTMEYAGGAPARQPQRFRSYGSYEEAFADYARLLRVRYQDVIGTRDPAAFARGLADAGYATDPAYADKLTRVIGSVTLRASLRG